MPKKFRLNPKPYEILKMSSLLLLVYSFAFAVTYELNHSLISYLSIIASTVFIFGFGYYVRKAFNDMSEEYSLIIKVSPVLFIGQFMYIISFFLYSFSFSPIMEFIGIILVLAYLLEFCLETLRLAGEFNLRELKISAYIILASLIAFVIVGPIPFSFILTIGSIIFYLGINKILYSQK
jgi:hypothetical protein